MAQRPLPRILPLTLPRYWRTSIDVANMVNMVEVVEVVKVVETPHGCCTLAPRPAVCQIWMDQLG